MYEASRSLTPKIPEPNQPTVRPRILLLAERGFIGSYVQRQALSEGTEEVVVSRALSDDLPTTQQLQWRALPLETMLHSGDWLPHLQGIDVVINCVGILRQRLGEHYEDLHHRMPTALAQACAKRGVRLIHTSALGLHEGAKSRFLSSKLRGEQAIWPVARITASCARA